MWAIMWPVDTHTKHTKYALHNTYADTSRFILGCFMVQNNTNLNIYNTVVIINVFIYEGCYAEYQDSTLEQQKNFVHYNSYSDYYSSI